MRSEPLQKLAFAWIILLLISLSLLTLYFFNPDKCTSINFNCNNARVTGNKASLILMNKDNDVEVLDITTSCDVMGWVLDGMYKTIVFESDQILNIEVECYDYFDSLELVMLYRDLRTNTTHSDIISIKR